MAKNITPYSRAPYPTIEGNDRVYFDNEFRKIQETLRGVLNALKIPTYLGQYTIASGVISVTEPSPSTMGWFYVDTEAAGATDDLDTINWDNGAYGQIVTIWAGDNARTVVLKDGTGNLHLAGDMTLDNGDDTITLQFFSGTNNWYELARSNNAA